MDGSLTRDSPNEWESQLKDSDVNENHTFAERC